jgi:hypothetical protein
MTGILRNAYFSVTHGVKFANLPHHFKALFGIFRSREQGIFGKRAGNFHQGSREFYG